MKYDVTILTDHRYVNPETIDDYTQNVLNEDRLLLEACQGLGLNSTRTNWDNPEFSWSDTRYIVFRTTWDYFERFGEFSKWLERVKNQTTLINSKDLIYWNLDKKYLIELEAKGVRIPPTKYIAAGSTKTLTEIAESASWNRFILKPAVSGAARHTYKIDSENIGDYEDLFASLISNENMILQEYQEQISTKGEVSYMIFGGKFSHAILKKAKSGDFRVQDDFGGSVHDYSPTAEEIAFAENALKQCPELPVYARVDVFWDNEDQLVLGELELIEPELWFRMDSGSAGKCASALKTFIENH